MRRVYDDARYSEIADNIMGILKNLTADRISEYSYGMYRAKTYKIRQYIESKMPFLKFGKNEHAYGIGNNNAIEIILAGDTEEQIVGQLHLTDNMFGGVICWCSDIDDRRRTHSLKFVGCDPNNEFDMTYKLYPKRV